MELRDHHFGVISEANPGGAGVRVDVGALVRRLLLFEHCTIESNRLREVPALVEAFGLGGVRTLLESGAVSIICDALTAGQIGQLAVSERTRDRGGPLPTGSFRLVSITLPTENEERYKYISGALTAFQDVRGPLKEIIKLKKILVPMLGTYPNIAGIDGLSTTRKEILTGGSTIWDAIRRVSYSERGIDLGEIPSFEVTDLGRDGDFRLDCSLTDHVDATEAHRLVERALLGVAGLNIRIYLMQHLEGVTGFRAEEFPFFEDKVGFMVRQLDPSAQEERFDRIVEITGLPGLAPLLSGTKINVNKLLKLRDSDECRDLRTWLRSVDKETDAEINDRFDSIRSQAADLIEGNIGHAVRWVFTTGAGFVPVAGPVLGPLASAADTFLVEKLIGRPGPATFLSRHYPSIFG